MKSILPDNVVANLKAVDPDRYRSALFADKAARAKLMTLYAFHAELAKVPELVSEPMLGEIRYQWWRECVDEIYSGKSVRKHEVASPLSEVLRSSEMPRFWVDRLIDGRARDLDPQPFGDITAAQSYCAQTSGVLMQMAVHLLGGEGGDAVLSAGEAWGLTGIARSWKYYTNGMVSEISFDDVCAAAKASHAKAKTGLSSLPPEVFPAVAYAALVPKFLSRLTRSGHDAATQSIEYTPVLKQLRLMGAVMTGRI